MTKKLLRICDVLASARVLMTPKLQVVVFWDFQEKETMSFPRTYAPVDENLEKVKNRGESSVVQSHLGNGYKSGLLICEGQWLVGKNLKSRYLRFVICDRIWTLLFCTGPSTPKNM
jgi:hypothetical protein